MSVQILADSASDLPLEYFQDNNIILFPLKVHLDDKEYDDQVTIKPKVVYDAMREGKAPKTSQVSHKVFTKNLKSWQKINNPGFISHFLPN